MEWKEKGLETIFGGVVLFLGSFFVKKAKPVWKELRRMSLLTNKVDELNKKAEITEKRLRALLAASSEPSFICNNEGEIIFVNAAWLEMTGMRKESDALGFGFLAVIPDDDIDDTIRDTKFFIDHPSSSELNVRYQHFVTKEIINTIVRAEPLKYDGELFETIGRVRIIK